jgi:hypothetical protein
VRVAALVAHADDAGTVSVCYNRPNQTQFMSNYVPALEISLNLGYF